MKKLLLICTALTLLASLAQAEILWDQYTPDPAVGAVNDFETGCGFSGTTMFHANDVSFDTGVRINSITTVYDYYNDPGLDLIDNCTEAYLMIVPKDGILDWPTDDPRTYAPVAVTITVVNIDGNDYQEVTASGLDIELVAGDYWVSFNPIAVTATGLTNQHYVATTLIGDDLLFVNACTGSAWIPASDPMLFGLPLDSTLLIEGDSGVVATENSSWSDVKSLYR